MRNYTMMRDVLELVGSSRRPVLFDDFISLRPRNDVVRELERLRDDGLIAGAVEFDCGDCVECRVAGLTDEGRQF